MHQDHLITVRPIPGGWRVMVDDLQPLMFLSGFQAERHARGLAGRLAALGDETQLLIHDRTSAVVGVQSYRAG